MEIRLIQDRRTTRFWITRLKDDHELLVRNARDNCDTEPPTSGTTCSESTSIIAQRQKRVRCLIISILFFLYDLHGIYIYDDRLLGRHLYKLASNSF